MTDVWNQAGTNPYHEISCDQNAQEKLANTEQGSAHNTLVLSFGIRCSPSEDSAPIHFV